MFWYFRIAILLLASASSSFAQAPADSSSVAPADSSSHWTAAGPRPDYSQQRWLDERPESLAAILRRLIDVEWNQHGEPGGAGFLHLSPLGNSGGEIWVEGVPSRNPADLEPAVWDLSAIDLLQLRHDGGHDRARAGFDLHGERSWGMPGRTRLHTQFSRSSYETYSRGLSFTTPQAQREVRADFEEWKSEDGFDFASPSTGATGSFGRAKLRRFHLAARAHSKLGAAVIGFGRGRRDSPGELLGSQHDPRSVERWTGQVYTGLDRSAADRHTRLRLFGLDWHEIDAVHGDARSDGARLGLSAAHEALRGGTSWSLSAERWSALWNLPDSTTQRARGRWVASVGAAQELRPTSAVSARLGLNALHAEQSGATDLGGAALLLWRGAGAELEFGLCRGLRAPSLLETDGWRRLDLADATQRDLVGGGKLAIEREDRAHAALSFRRGGFAARAQVESWRLSRGIGQEPVGADQLRFVGHVKLRRSQGVAQLEWTSRFGSLRVVSLLAGRAIFGALETQDGRGAGWPRASGQGRLRVELPVRNPRNLLLFEVGYSGTGTQFDDRTAALTPAAQLPWHDWVDLRAGLRVGEAELYLALDNALDATAVESLGTAQRPRQLRFGLAWTFWN